MNFKIINQISEAIEAGDLALTTELLARSDMSLDVMTPFGTFLHVAADSGQLEIVKLLVRLGASVDVNGGIVGGAPLDCAASEGHAEVVRFLIGAGAKIDVSLPTRNPLFGAIYGGHLDIVKLLVQAGIDWRVRYTGESMKNMDALAFARERGQTEIAQYLDGLESRRT